MRTQHISRPRDGFSFDLPTYLHPVPVSVLKGKAGKDVTFLAVEARPDGVVAEDVIVAVYPGRLLVTVPVLRALLGAASHPVHVSTALVSFGRVLKGTVAMTGTSGRTIRSTAYLFFRGPRTYVVAFNGLTFAGDNRVASVVMGTWGR